MNAATAGGVLGGDPVVAIMHPGVNKDDATCTFTVQKSTFTITVQTIGATRNDLSSYGAHCKSKGEPLRGIGNEAIACSIDGAEQVVGRVRDRVFIVNLTTADSMRVKAHFVAEQVAGNLF